MKNIFNKLFIASFLFANLAWAGTFSVDQLQANGVTAPTLTSTVATGTPPLTVTSTTPVPNLTAANATNATNLLAGGTIASTVGAVTQPVGSSGLNVATTAFVNPGSSITTNGYRKFPDGLIMQWATVTVSGSLTVTTNYPISFPNAFYSITSNSLAGVNVTPSTGTASANSFVVQNNNTGAVVMYIIALGH